MQGKMRKHKIQRKHRIKRQECEEIKNICTVATESLNCRSSFADVEKKKNSIAQSQSLTNYIVQMTKWRQ